MQAFAKECKCRYAKPVVCHPAAALLMHHQKQQLRKASFPHGFADPVPQNLIREDSGGDALRGNTRTHPEHDG